MTIQKALDKLKKHLQEQGRSMSTITAYTKDIQQLTDYLMKKKIQDINNIESQHLGDYVEKMKTDKKNNYTLKTISRKINSMKTFFKYACNSHIIDTNPTLAIKHPKYKLSPPRVLTKMEYSALRDITRTNLRLFTIVELLLQTGMRIGELARLSIDDINLETSKKYFSIRPYGSNPKRQIAINQAAETALHNYLKIRPQPRKDINALFITKNGRPLLVRNIRTSITRALKKIGISNATVNDIRNTFIIHQLNNGMPTELLCSIMGHKRVTSTKRYLQLIQEKPKRKTTKIVPL